MTSGGKKDPTYIDDVFHTEVFVSPNQNADYKVTNNIDNAGEGGFLWYKQRNGTSWNLNWDTVRGSNKYIYTNSSSAESTSELLKSFDSDGYTIKTGTTIVDPARENVLWNFRKAPGFFDIVTYTGTGSALNINHNLGCVPGMIIVKCTSAVKSWVVYHRQMNGGVNPEQYAMFLNGSGTQDQNIGYWNNTAPTATQFTLGDSAANENGESHVAYIFAGGESTAATARSVDFDGSGDYLTQPTTAAFTNWWDQAFTVEYWVNADGFVSSGNGGSGVLGVCAPTSNSETWSFGPKSNGTVEFYYWNGSIQQVTTTRALNKGQWYHLAMCYDGSNSIKIYINGTLEKSATVQGTPSGDSNSSISIGKIANGSEFDGKVSNVRITHQALYASSFKPPVEPLTQTSQSATSSNVKLLCCNNSSTTGSTVTPGTITANGDPTASTDIPFDDPEGFKFGGDEDQNIIKTGSYKGNGNANGPEVYLGWEPQWILVKCAENSESWVLFDSMRGIVSGGNDFFVEPNDSGAENTFQNWIQLTPTGIKIINPNYQVNQNNKTYIYTCIRRPDAYVGKPPELGTDVFAMDYGNASSTSSIATYDSGFPVGFSIRRQPATSQSWYASSRLTGTKSVTTNTSDAEVSDSNLTWDRNDGVGKWTGDLSSYLMWMWKRYAGFDVVTNTSSEWVSHNLGRVPEMVIIKHRTVAENWFAWHKDLNGGGSNSIGYWMYLNSNSAEANWGNICPIGNTLPTATHFQSDSDGAVRSADCIAFLFASVEGISKVGSYTGNASSSGPTITLGFAPRFIIIKCASVGGSDWFVFDTLRGLASGNDKRLSLNTNNGQETGDFIDPSSTGFQVVTSWDQLNDNNANFIYYAHA